MESTGYDFIGDIHGHCDELNSLLRLLGYRSVDGVLEQPERKAVFLGDFIDRGPKIREVIETVRPMVESGAAFAVMGNHELNALAFHNFHPDYPDQPIRPHSEKNLYQHQATLDQLTDGELADALNWFSKLPMWYDFVGARAVHACWSSEQIKVIEQHQKDYECSGRLNARFLAEAFNSSGEAGTALYRACEDVLKGTETKLPEGYLFKDTAGVHRHHIRTRWFSQGAETYQQFALGETDFYHESDPDQPVSEALPLPSQAIDASAAYSRNAAPCFIGHYWLRAAAPSRLTPNVACLDYSVAKGGFLCAYRWDGEHEIDDSKFVWTS